MSGLLSAERIGPLIAERRPLLLTVILGVAFYWLVYIPYMQTGGVDPTHYTARFLVNPEVMSAPEIAEDDVYVEHEGSWQWQTCPGPCYFAARLLFEPESLTGDYGVLASYNTDGYEIHVNGHRVAAPGRLEPLPSFHGQRSSVHRIPGSILQPGVNTVDILLGRHIQTARFNGAFIGPYDEVVEATKTRIFMLYEYRQLNATVGLILGGLALVLVVLVRNRRLLFWFATIALCWGLLGMFRTWHDFPFEYGYRVAYYFFLLNLIYLAIFNFYDLWSGENRAWQRHVAGAFFMVIMLLYVGLQPWYSVLDLEAWLSDAFQIVISGWLTIRALRHYLLVTEQRVVEAAAMLVCISSITVDAWAQYLGFNSYYTMPRTLIVFIIAILASLFHRNIRLYESQQVLNDVLEEKVKEQQVSLEASYQQLRELDREKTLSEERRRLLSDMHDGLGGQLVSLLAGLRSGTMNQDSVRLAIEQSLQDLRLLIDSLDDVSDDLVVALGTFRSRIEPMLNNAGMTLNWQVDALPLGTHLSPTSVLNVFRILQEAVTNAVKHAAATEIEISDALSADGQSYRLMIVDAGASNVSASGGAKGYGLDSMRQRAKDLGGELEVSLSSTGSVVCLTMPTPQ